MSYLKGRVVFIFFICLLNTPKIFGQEQKIKPGDAIDIMVYGHQELSRVVTVSPKGTVDFPFLQNIPVDGLTLNEFRDITSQVHEGMQFDGPFGFSKSSPRKQGKAEIDGAGIQGINGII